MKEIEEHVRKMADEVKSYREKALRSKIVKSQKKC